MDFPERDWRVFLGLRGLALERFCRRVLAEIGAIASGGGSSWHARYGRVFARLQRRDGELARAFDGPSRSRALVQLAAIVSQGLLTPVELERFTRETRERLRVLPPHFRRGRP